MGLLDASYSAVNTKKPSKSDRILPGEELNARGLLDAATNVPIAGDALSGVLAAYDAAKGDYGSAAVNALGVLPFVSGSIINGGMNTAKKAIDSHVAGVRVKPKQIAELTQEQFDGINALRKSNGLPLLPSRKIDYVGRHHQDSRGADGYATQDMLKQLMSSLDDSAVASVDRVGRPQLVSTIDRHDGYGNVVRDAAILNVDGNRTLAEAYSVIPKGDKGNRPVDQIKKMAGSSSGELSGSIANRLRQIDEHQPLSSLVTEQEVRNWIAQDNAAKMLGLPANNAALDRAKAMGFDTPAYHGTNADVPEFDMSMVGSSTVLPLGAPKGAYFAKEQSVAGRYARGSDSGANVMPVMLNKDGALLDNSKIVVTDKPENIRSRFAAFDPARRNEADILGYADPRLLGLIGGGGLLGLGAYKANQE